MQLQKATIAELDDSNKPKDEFPVQFNPTSLSLNVTNRIEGGQAVGRQVRQYIGSSSTTLTFDLIFDTADEGTTDSPRSVREKTEMVERFLRPKGKDEKKFVAPRVRFHWNELVFDGVVDALTISLDHFAANGAPLRAKITVTIKEQNRDLELLVSGPGANRKSNAATPGLSSAGGIGGGFSASAGIGFGASASIGFSASANVGVALGGESAADFAARVGVDPAAWRGLDLGGESSLSLSAGAEIGFDAGLSASAGLGVTVGIEAGVSASVEASFGLEASAGVSAVTGVGVGAGLAAGFALSSAGGVSAALEATQDIKNQSAEQQARQAFNAPPRALLSASASSNQAASLPARSSASSNTSLAPSAQPAASTQGRAPLKSAGIPSPSAQQAAAPAPRPPRADQRASSFGFGVPLRSTVGEAADLRASSVQGGVALKSRVSPGEPPMTSDPTRPHWVALPERDRGRNAADKVQQVFRPSRLCGCAGRCKH
ncbi:MAG TPA: hypothetical protein VJZ26_10105 [Blastocatellia bacterium]|nr:hypothetical protein [Blastocatellia bacterium]